MVIQAGATVSAVIALFGVLWQGAATQAEVRTVKHSMDQQFGQVDASFRAVNGRLDNLEGFRAQADRRTFAELIMACANRRLAEAECNARLPAEIRDVMWQQPARGGR